MLTKSFLSALLCIFVNNFLTIYLNTMKKLIMSVMLLFLVPCVSGQKKEPSYTIQGDNVKVIHYFPDGSVYKRGFFKNKRLTGEWIEFNQEGNKVATGFYIEGKKSGTWFRWNKNKLRQINYKNNTIVSVTNWREQVNLVVNK